MNYQCRWILACLLNIFVGAVATPRVECAEEPAPKLVTRYSVGTQTTFLEENPLNLERDENEPEPNRVTGKEKFRKTLRLSTDAIVSNFFLEARSGLKALMSFIC
jgi:hypothetical protein